MIRQSYVLIYLVIEDRYIIQHRTRAASNCRNFFKVFGLYALLRQASN